MPEPSSVSLRWAALAAAVVAALAAAGGVAVQSRGARHEAAIAAVDRAEARRERVAQFRLLQTPASVVMLGDSLTAQGEWSELLARPVANRGLAGDTVAGVASRLDAVPTESEVVFLMIGVNDLSGGAEPADVARRTRDVVGAIGPKRVILQSVLMTDDAMLNRRIVDLNRLNEETCRAMACRYLELNDMMAPDGKLRDDLDLDGVHLRARAYLLWANRVLATLD